MHKNHLTIFDIINDKNYQVCIEGMYLNIIKAIYDKSIANIMLILEKLKVFLLGTQTRQG